MVIEIWSVTNRIFLSFWTISVLLPPPLIPKNLKNQNFEKMKKRPGDISILLKFTKHHNHTLYCHWDIACDGCIIVILNFGLFIAVLPPNLSQQSTFKRMKRNSLEILSCCTSVPKIMMIYAILFLRHGAWRMYLVFLIFRYFLPFYPNSPKN